MPMTPAERARRYRMRKKGEVRDADIYAETSIPVSRRTIRKNGKPFTPTELQRRWRARQPTIARRKRHAVRETVWAGAIPPGRYGVILADPPWSYETRSDNGMNRSADNHYVTQSTEWIAALPVAAHANADCVLFLWATAPMLPEALGVMASWGFAYKTSAVWTKDKVGTGYWLRNRHEYLLIGTVGRPVCPAPGMQWDSVIAAAVREHSRKPDEGYALIESYFPSVSKLELFCRGPARAGWSVFGNEAVILEAAE